MYESKAAEIIFVHARNMVKIDVDNELKMQMLVRKEIFDTK